MQYFPLKLLYEWLLLLYNPGLLLWRLASHCNFMEGCRLCSIWAYFRLKFFVMWLVAVELLLLLLERLKEPSYTHVSRKWILVYSLKITKRCMCGKTYLFIYLPETCVRKPETPWRSELSGAITSAALSNRLHHRRLRWGATKLTRVKTDVNLVFLNPVLNKVLLVTQQRRHYLFPTEWRTVCDTAFASWQNNLHSVSVFSHKDRNPQKAAGWLMLLSADCLALLFSLPQTTLRPECSLVMKRQTIETVLTLIWHHDCATPRFFSFHYLFSKLRGQSALTSAFRLALFLFPLSVCQTALQHSEFLALYALHLIFIWGLKARGMPSSPTPCEEPVESWLNVCSVGRLDLTHSDIIAQRMQIFDALRLSVFYSSSLLFSFKRALQQAASNKRRRSNIYPRQNSITVFPRLPFLSRSHSPKTLKDLLPFFITNVQMS